MQAALESGYRNLSLFNLLFKKRFGMTPSACRQKSSKKNGKLHCLIAGLILFLLAGATALHAAAPPAPFSEPPPPANSEAAVRAQETLRRKMIELDDREGITNARPVPAISTNIAPLAAVSTNAAATSTVSTNTASTATASTNTGPAIEVKGYELLGNTLLPPAITDPILQKHTGAAVTFDSIRQGLAGLQMAYRERGYVTVAVGLPQQQLTNGIVKVQVTEGRLA